MYDLELCQDMSPLLCIQEMSGKHDLVVLTPDFSTILAFLKA